MAESSQDDAKLDLKVRDGNGAVTHFKVKKSTKFRKILTARCGVILRQRRGIIQSTQAYAGKAGISPDTIRMMVDGQRVNLEQCPGDYDMESGDQIDAMAEQQGGLGRDPAAAAAAELRANEALQARLEADVNRANGDGVTPLFIACQQGHVDVAREGHVRGCSCRGTAGFAHVLLDRGAGVNATAPPQ